MTKKNTPKKEALTTRLFITNILEKTLDIPSKNIVNDSVFKNYTENKRADLLISEIPYIIEKNDDDFINKLVAYSEVKDPSAKVNDYDWNDAIRQGKEKSIKLNMPYYIVTNLNVSYFYNSKNQKELKLNGNPIREFLSLELLKYIKNYLIKNPETDNIIVNSDTSSVISEDVFNKKLWELENIYRNISFNNQAEKIDFTIGFIVLKYYEEKIQIMNEEKNDNMIYWSGLKIEIENIKSTRDKIQFIKKIKNELEQLEKDSQFSEMTSMIENVIKIIIETDENDSYLYYEEVIDIFNVIENMGKLHASGFDIFGSIYEKFASNEEKKTFGEFFTRRHYTHIFTKLLLKEKLENIDENTNWKILDPACGTGGFLTEAFKIIKNKIEEKYYVLDDKTIENIEKIETKNNILDKLKKSFIHGFDIKNENISRAKLNMFLVGDGHTNIKRQNTLRDIKIFDENNNKLITEKDKYDFIIANPPYGTGVDKAETNAINTTRYELAFIVKIINILKENGEACLIIPHGFFQNPSYSKLRKEVLEKCEIKAIISLPTHAFAPYTKEKTYAIYLKKKTSINSDINQKNIWMYIIDNDGFANSDKRFVTNLKKNDGEWMHNEISSYITNESEEMEGVLEQRWLNYNDEFNLTEYINEKGILIKIRKAGFIKVNDENGVCEENYWNLLPEYYLRQQESETITIEDFDKEINSLLNDLKGLGENK